MTCKECPDYRECRKYSDLRINRKRCPKAKEPYIRTNADRIRAMSDDELATFINKIVVNHHIKNADNCNHCPLKGAKPCDTEGIIDWLKQPAEVNNG